MSGTPAFDTIQRPPAGLKYLGYAQITSLVAATALPTAPAKTVLAIIGVEGGNVRWRADGTDPTGDIGSILWGTSGLPFTSALFSSAKFINFTGSTSLLNIEWYGGN